MKDLEKKIKNLKEGLKIYIEKASNIDNMNVTSLLRFYGNVCIAREKAQCLNQSSLFYDFQSLEFKIEDKIEQLTK